jgi:hypothetical protein
MDEVSNVSLADFLEQFPEVKLPITLTDESSRIFSQTNEPFPQRMIDQYLIPLEEEVDEFTEFVPCFRIPDTYEFHAVVYWVAQLMNYQYVLVTFSREGMLIDKKVLAGTFYDGQTLTNSVATLDEDWTILMVSGQSTSDTNYDASGTRTQKLEILPEGQIIIL